MNSDKRPLVSIITINFNQPEVTQALLDSLGKITYPNLEVVVVDNASHQNPADFIHKNYPEVKFIRSDQNLGFAGGNNLGIRASKGKYLMMLNNDTEVDPGFLEPLVEKMEQDPKVGMVGSKVRFYDMPDTIQFAGATPMSRFTATSHFIGFNTIDHGQYDYPKVTPFASGAAMMTSREVCKKVGLMADFFFLYYEELDWQERIREAGFEIWYIPESLVYHKESVSVGRESALQAYWKNRNRLLLIRRNFSKMDVVISFLYITFISTPYNFGKYILKGRLRLLKVHFIALGWHYYNMFNHKRIHQNDYL
ncbi:MAG: glycosyltransferase family 2 protein [Bacteroidales bacterium]|nr:glycosyltransferase family 2 protein [Bacteroidales bacterium]MCF8376950.1 glycosyltransferase family 2 protein [Bacteroidales bacterium]MCF8401292.1 glycosyltransferase family 2 protein [Bacteroidales bacterium]